MLSHQKQGDHIPTSPLRDTIEGWQVLPAVVFVAWAIYFVLVTSKNQRYSLSHILFFSHLKILQPTPESVQQFVKREPATSAVSLDFVAQPLPINHRHDKYFWVLMEWVLSNTALGFILISVSRASILTSQTSSSCSTLQTQSQWFWTFWFLLCYFPSLRRMALQASRPHGTQQSYVLISSPATILAMALLALLSYYFFLPQSIAEELSARCILLMRLWGIPNLPSLSQFQSVLHLGVPLLITYFLGPILSHSIQSIQSAIIYRYYVGTSHYSNMRDEKCRKDEERGLNRLRRLLREILNDSATVMVWVLPPILVILKNDSSMVSYMEGLFVLALIVQVHPLLQDYLGQAIPITAQILQRRQSNDEEDDPAQLIQAPSAIRVLSITRQAGSFVTLPLLLGILLLCSHYVVEEGRGVDTPFPSSYGYSLASPPSIIEAWERRQLENRCRSKTFEQKITSTGSILPKNGQELLDGAPPVLDSVVGRIQEFQGKKTDVKQQRTNGSGKNQKGKQRIDLFRSLISHPLFTRRIIYHLFEHCRTIIYLFWVIMLIPRILYYRKSMLEIRDSLHLKVKAE